MLIYISAIAYKVRRRRQRAVALVTRLANQNPALVQPFIVPQNVSHLHHTQHQRRHPQSSYQRLEDPSAAT